MSRALASLVTPLIAAMIRIRCSSHGMKRQVSMSGLSGQIYISHAVDTERDRIHRTDVILIVVVVFVLAVLHAVHIRVVTLVAVVKPRGGIAVDVELGPDRGVVVIRVLIDIVGAAVAVGVHVATDKRREGRDPGVHAGVIRLGAAVPPAHHAREELAALEIGDDERAAAVALAGVLTTDAHIAGAELGA
jgi:hypothetical protein